MNRNDRIDAASDARQSLEEAMRFNAVGDLAGAEKRYIQVLSKEYRTTDILPLLAGIVAKRGDTEMALYYWNKLLAINPAHLTALIEKGGLLYRTGRVAEAVVSYEIARGLAPDNALIRNNLAVALADLKRIDEAVMEFRQVLRLQPNNINALHQIRKLTATVVPFWHIAMMNDKPRNDAFEAAILRAIALRGPDAPILDIGTGSGLLSMMAARGGARNIVTCEAVPVIARAAETIIAENGYRDDITLINKISTEIGVGRGLETKAEILISEILSSDLLTENVLPTFEDAKRRLLTDDAIIIPRVASAIGCLVASEDLARHSHIAHASGFNLSAFNPLAPQRLPLHGTMTEWTRLSDDFEIARLDLTADSNDAAIRSQQIPVTASGTAIGVVQWMKVELIDDIVFANHPDDYHDGGWLQVLHVFPQKVEVEAGSVLKLLLGHDRSSLIVMAAEPAPRAAAQNAPASESGLAN